MQDCARPGAQLWWPSGYALAFLITLLSFILTPRVATRWMLGVMEAGLVPGVVYYLSWYNFLIQPPTLNFSDVHFFFHSWYKRSEYGIRVAIFFSAATASGAFGGLLAVCGPKLALANPVTHDTPFLSRVPGGHLKNGWGRGKARMGVDIHPRGLGDDSCRRRLILHHPRFS